MSKKNNSKLISDGMLGALIIVIAALIVFAIVMSLFLIVAKPFSGGTGIVGSKQEATTTKYPFRQNFSFSTPTFAENSVVIETHTIKSERAVVLNVTDNKIVASRQAETVMYPASMTKVMTLITVYENLTSEAALNEILTISKEVQERMEAEESSGYGFKAGEKLTVKELMYAMILRSDNIACVTLAEYIAGSEANFVKLMNEKAKSLGLSQSTTLFQNCTGLHHIYHYTTCKDIATIMSYAMKNTFCAEILTSLKCVPGSHFRPGEGSVFYNALLVHDLGEGQISPDNATIKAGKSGFTDYDTSGQCLVSYAKADNGDEYIVVTSNAPAKPDRHNDHVFLYETYIE
ncbi:MAG: D-alanyl-D-alanine carboxypeptidase [Ruminococcaceae bacterium]|nr:D-alanyl-D-alanine carboxypeptidase [Oscillospiraceae bacterium]